MTYKVWSNPQTYAVALTLKAYDSYDEFIREFILKPPINEEEKINRLIKFCITLEREIRETCPWAWKEVRDLKNAVNWIELVNKYMER